MDFCDDLETKILDIFLLSGTGVIAAPAVKVRLYLADPTDTPTTANEVQAGLTAGGYVAGGFAATFGGGPNPVANSGDITFPAATLAWGTITHLVVQGGTGDFLFKGAFTTSKTVGVGDQLVIKSGALVIGTD